MTRQERLKFCKTCRKRKFNPQKGIICSVTEDIAMFEDTCADYLVDEKIEALEVYKREINEKEKAKKTKVKKVKTRVPEKITENDFYLLLSGSLLAAFLIRLILYIENEAGNFLIFLMVIFLSFSGTLLLRKNESGRYRLFGDIKFKVLFSVFVTLINLVFVILVYPVIYGVGSFGFMMLFSSLFLSFLSYILVSPIHYLYRKLK